MIFNWKNKEESAQTKDYYKSSKGLGILLSKNSEIQTEDGLKRDFPNGNKRVAIKNTFWVQVADIVENTKEIIVILGYFNGRHGQNERDN